MSNLEILKSLKKYLIDFLDQIISIFPYEADLVLVRIFLKDQVPIKDVMEAMKARLESCRKMIETRNEKFFLQDGSIFGELNSGKVDHFRNLWVSDEMDDENKEAIWKWIDLFVKITDKYEM